MFWSVNLSGGQQSDVDIEKLGKQFICMHCWQLHEFLNLQESPAIADKPAWRESLPKIAPIRRAYNVVTDNTGLSSFV